MAKKLSPLERQIYENIKDEMLEKAFNTTKEGLWKRKIRKISASLKQANIIFILRREQYKKIYRLGQTKFVHQYPNVFAQLKKDYERDYNRKLKFVALGRRSKPILTIDRKIRKSLLNQKYYYIKKQRKLAQQFDTAGFVSYEK